MENKETYINIIDSYEAETLYNWAIFYGKDSLNTDVEVDENKSRADNINHQWREDTFKIIDAERNLKSEVILTYYSFPREIPEQGLPLHTLEIIVKGEYLAQKFTIKKLGIISGLNIEKYIG